MLERMIDVGDVKLHVVSKGDVKTGEGARPPVILLHGFPEFWYSWRHQLDGLAKAGLSPVAPDMRGYNLSDKPSGVSAYRVEKLAGDVIGLIKALGHERADVVGHDWGGAVAWYLAMRFPERVRKLAVLNCPHPRLFARALRSPAQLKKSWYFFFFQLPLLPERQIVKDGFAARALRGSAARKEAFTDEDLARYTEAYRRPGAATGAINYYRAVMRRMDLRMLSGDPVRVPTLILWGQMDRFIGEELLDGTEQLVPDLRIHRIAGASHWVQQDAPEEVNQQLIAFLKD